MVQGQLGWHDVVTVHLTQAAGLGARLLSLPPHCCAVRIAQCACTQSQSWIQSVLDELHNHGVPHPHDAGIHMGCPSPSLRRWLRDVNFALGSHADARYATTLSACNSLRTYACWQPCPQLHRIVYGPHVAACNVVITILLMDDRLGTVTSTLSQPTFLAVSVQTQVTPWHTLYLNALHTMSCDKGGETGPGMLMPFPCIYCFRYHPMSTQPVTS